MGGTGLEHTQRGHHEQRQRLQREKRPHANARLLKDLFFKKKLAFIFPFRLPLIFALLFSFPHITLLISFFLIEE